MEAFFSPPKAIQYLEKKCSVLLSSGCAAAFPKTWHCETPVGDVSGDVCVALDVQGAITLSCLAAGNTSSSFANSRGACQLHYWLT